MKFLFFLELGWQISDCFVIKLKYYAQNSQQKSVPDLYVVTVAFLALKKPGFFTFSDLQKQFQNFFYKIIM